MKKILLFLLLFISAYSYSQNVITGITYNGRRFTVWDSDSLNNLKTRLETAINAKGAGTVTSVGISLPVSLFSNGSAITTNGNLSATFINQSQFTVFARGSGTGIPSFLALSEAHIPSLSFAKMPGLADSLAELNKLRDSLNALKRKDSVFAAYGLEVRHDPVTGKDTIALIGVTGSPGNNKMYGTNGSGEWGMLDIPDPGAEVVRSFAGRNGDVSPATNDYNFAQIAGTIAEGQQPTTTVRNNQDNEFGDYTISRFSIKYNNQSGSTYTLQLSDNGMDITFANTCTVTVPTGLPIGFNCTITQGGSGQVTISGSGTTVNNSEGHTKTAKQHAVCGIKATGTNVFNFYGNTGN